MFQAGLILIMSTGLALFYLHRVCEQILHREFARPYFKAVVNANCLEFPNLRKALNEPAAPMDYPQSLLALKCDFMTLARLLKMSPRVGLRYSREDRLMVFYSRIAFLSLSMRHLLRLGEKRAVLKLTAILQYLANVAGQRQLEFVPNDTFAQLL
jgi:hypothetical protein